MKLVSNQRVQHCRDQDQNLIHLRSLDFFDFKLTQTHFTQLQIYSFSWLTFVCVRPYLPHYSLVQSGSISLNDFDHMNSSSAFVCHHQSLALLIHSSFAQVVFVYDCCCVVYQSNLFSWRYDQSELLEMASICDGLNYLKKYWNHHHFFAVEIPLSQVKTDQSHHYLLYHQDFSQIIYSGVK